VCEQVRIFPFSAIQLTSYPFYKNLLGVEQQQPPGGRKLGKMFVAGCLAGITATSFTCGCCADLS